MRIIDLSVPIRSGMPVYPGDPEVTIRPALRVAVDGVNVLHLDMGSQTGTHVDAPRHIDDSLPTLDELPLGLAELLAVQEAGRRMEVSLFPLNLPGADGAPVRAVARVEG